MEWIIDNWFILLGLVAVLIIVGWLVYKFFGLPTKEQIAKIKEWLLWAVTEAELELGSGTGQLKLRYVYDLFVARFPLVARIVSFEMFAKWVDEALEEMKKLLAENEAVRALVEFQVTE